MALINCPECGKEVSDKAGTCPNCGYPLKKNKGTPSFTGMNICPKCGEVNRATECPMCGTEMIDCHCTECSQMSYLWKCQYRKNILWKESIWWSFVWNI